MSFYNITGRKGLMSNILVLPSPTERKQRKRAHALLNYARTRCFYGPERNTAECFSHFSGLG